MARPFGNTAGDTPLSQIYDAAPLVCDFYGNYFVNYAAHFATINKLHLFAADFDFDDDDDVDGKCLQCKCLTIICTVSNHFGACAPSQ